MKNIMIIVLLTLTSVSYGQTNKNTLVEELLIETQAEESTRYILGGIIRQYIGRKPNAPKNAEEEIQKAINYKSYMLKVKNAYDINYTEAEIKELLRLHKSEQMEEFKQKSEKVAKSLYNIGSVFGKEAVQVIVSYLQKN